ncbi:kinase-like domain-containing protein [Suillus fuscotomentosus]|uniref:Kinase-like domain-containing protein n=1 Tax=Suillus fuscotomentosus TaxID=1912939 RepID=A0AAD4E5R2_9AGAM|nr:kinase-like domain-containing protein [Suillus fuscotomentosus]KAG1900067.1 kinase-like domain-containing protein [Suillus fuscotomentosus]
MNPVNPEPEIPATDLINSILSAPGSYSDVYKCTLTTGSESTLVAVKFIRFGRHKEYYDRILREIHLRRRLNHPNIIQLLGTTGDFQDGNFPSLVFPWMPSGDLDCYIAYHGAGIEASLKLSLARDIASGVTYLHESHVVHGNLESKNILIGPENRAYLTGFSLATDLDKPFTTPEPGGVRFAAPECFINKKGNSSLSIINRDIYSIGCILLHVFSGCLPWHDSRSSDIINRLRQRRMPPRPVGGGIDDSLWNFITRCCSFIPRDRPSATQILEFLKYQYKPSEVDISSDDLTEMLCNRPPFHTVSGGFAYITKCTLKRDWNTIQVAAKSIRFQRDVPDQKEYLRERKLWERLMQENILPLLGVARGFDAAPGCDALVCPWMENGTLSKYIDRYPAMELRQKLKLLCDVATGLRYLHSQGIVHGDLTDNNILVDVNGRAVVADFGLSFRISEHTGSYPVTAAARWMAPELAMDDSTPSIHSDMYSFGSIMNYVISGALPFASDPMPDTAIYRGKAPCTIRGNNVSQKHWDFIQRCWGHIASSRPSAEEACELLRSEPDSNF